MILGEKKEMARQRERKDVRLLRKRGEMAIMRVSKGPVTGENRGNI